MLFQVFITLHAYSQSWLVPSSQAHAPFADDGVLVEMGKLATIALADLYGTKYQVSNVQHPQGHKLCHCPIPRNKSNTSFNVVAIVRQQSFLYQMVLTMMRWPY